jgi:hypothetical protein
MESGGSAVFGKCQCAICIEVLSWSFWELSAASKRLSDGFCVSLVKPKLYYKCNTFFLVI